MKTIWFPDVVKNIFIKSICNTSPKHSQRKDDLETQRPGHAQNGQRHVDQKKRKQMVVTEDSENVWHSLPSQKKRRSVHQSHSLAGAVSANRAAEKKH